MLLFSELHVLKLSGNRFHSLHVEWFVPLLHNMHHNHFPHIKEFLSSHKWKCDCKMIDFWVSYSNNSYATKINFCKQYWLLSERKRNKAKAIVKLFIVSTDLICKNYKNSKYIEQKIQKYKQKNL